MANADVKAGLGGGFVRTDIELFPTLKPAISFDPKADAVNRLLPISGRSEVVVQSETLEANFSDGFKEMKLIFIR